MGMTDGVLRYFDESGRNNSIFNAQPAERITAPFKDMLEPWVDKYADIFLLGGAALLEAGRKGGTPTLGWWHCPRHGARPFRERYAPPHLPLGTLCGPTGVGFENRLFYR